MASLTDRLEHDSLGIAAPQIDAPAPGWRLTLSNALIITRREVRDSLRDWRIMVPIFLLTLIFPLLANAMTLLFTNFFEDQGAKEDLLPALLPLMPMIVGFFPVSISLVIALETFVGEKERRSLEPLLSTPLSNTELYLGKTIAAMLPPLAASYTGEAIYIGGLILGSQRWRPEPLLLLQIGLMTTVQALVMVTGAVVVSSQTTSTRAANLLASFIIVPMSILVMLEGFIMVQPHLRYVLWFITLGLLVTVVLLIRMGTRIFNREELLGRALDTLNLRWAWHIFWQQLRGPAQGRLTLARWYRTSVLPATRPLRAPLLVALLCVVIAFIGGLLAAGQWPYDLSGYDASDETLIDNLQRWFALGDEQPRLVALIIGQNARVMILATVLATFTFGVLALIVVMMPFALLGFIMGQVTASGIDALPFIMAIVPHGIVEIPALLIAGAAALRLGSIVTHPPSEMTVGETWLRALADTVKVGTGIVLPMLIVAGILEVMLTPRVVEFVLSL